MNRGNHACFSITLITDKVYYVPIIKTAQDNQEKHPDITIECCNSLVQGISKTFIFSLLSSFLTSLSKLPNIDIRKLLKNESVHVQFSTALNVLEKDIDDSEFFKLIEKAYDSLENKNKNNKSSKDIDKIKLIFQEAVKISQQNKGSEETKLLIACKELLN